MKYKKYVIKKYSLGCASQTLIRCVRNFKKFFCVRTRRILWCNSSRSYVYDEILYDPI